jgi:hypothetical protein
MVAMTKRLSTLRDFGFEIGAAAFRAVFRRAYRPGFPIGGFDVPAQAFRTVQPSGNVQQLPEKLPANVQAIG